jgi:small redox-active disulfide protein 2
MDIRILGASCARCRQLLANVERAVRELGIAAAVTKVDDIDEIIKYGVLTIPALVVDGKVLSAGRVLSPEGVKRLLA